jgi:hypothetical protein
VDRETAAGCIARIGHTAVRGAARYVVEHPAVGSIQCALDTSPLVCVAVFPNGPPGCGVTMRGVDDDGRLGLPSASFCVRGVEDDDQPAGSRRQQNSTFARTPGVRANG